MNKKLYKKGEKTLKILSVVGHAGLVLIDIADFFFSGAHQTTKLGANKVISKLNDRHEWWNNQIEKKRELNRLQGLLHKLYRQGLVIKIKTKKEIKWILTEKGEKHQTDLLRSVSKACDPIPFSSKYPITKSKNDILIIFDIPEKERAKRDWLRDVLKKLGMEKLQHSVWIGKIKPPPDLIVHLHKLRMLRWVKIFSLKNLGNINLGDVD